MLKSDSKDQMTDKEQIENILEEFITEHWSLRSGSNLEHPLNLP